MVLYFMGFAEFLTNFLPIVISELLHYDQFEYF